MLRRYSFFGHRGKGNAVVAMIDGRSFHGGLTDRWKGIVSLYALCKVFCRDFRIHYTYPFQLTMFQQPNCYDWRIDNSELSRNIRSVDMLRLTGDPSLGRVMHLPQNKQIHCYANRDWIPVINTTFGTSYEWGQLFKELFKPSPVLQNELNRFSAYTKMPYAAVALRMQNLLGDYEEYKYQPATEERQKEIIQAMLNEIEHVHSETGMRVLVTSDSKRMTDAASRFDYVFTNSQLAAHVDTVDKADARLYLKSFVDFYLLAGAMKVYAPRTKEMYMSDFPQYAAKVENIDFIRTEI
ncbi:MAG: hypothetical protein IJ776_03060 [Paludibacteraceae bacterium]|nr:hypothetical protein [Paludibacteraceae bacterium]